MIAYHERDIGTLDIYRASAGSGKTFSLTLEYLKLLVSHPYKYREILAVTFTNKATAEMKLRILDTLRALGNEEPTPYTALLQQHLGPQINLGQTADLLYRHILHDYGRFHVSTIDAFVQRIIRSFAYEIGLDSGYRIELNTTLVKETLARRLYELLDEDPALQRWILELATQQIEEGKNWDFQFSMLQLAEELFKERFHDFEQATRQMSDPASVFESFRSGLFIRKTQYEKQLASLAQEAVDMIQANGLDVTDFAYGKSGFAAWFLKPLKGTFKDKPGKRFYEAADKPEKWLSSKATSEVILKVQTLHAPLGTLMHEILEVVDREYPLYISTITILQNIYQLNLMRIMARELAWYREQNNALLISDTQALLRALISGNEAPFIYEKIGNRFNHFLMDEFQDTSAFQWDNFRPLLENALAEGHYNLVVGDVKQAIYRWRNGDWRLLLNGIQRSFPAPQSDVHVLEENYRSTETIIDFNNFMFSEAPRHLQRHYVNEYMYMVQGDLRERMAQEGFATMIEQAYQDSVQQKPKTCKKGGFLDLHFIPSPSLGDRKNVLKSYVDDHLPSMVEELLKKGYQPGSIGILTRGNRQARHIMDILLEHQHVEGSLTYPVVSADALYIGSAWSVKLLLSFFTLLINDTHALAWAQLRHCLHVLNLVEAEEAERFQGLDAHTADSYLPRPFKELSRHCKGLPLGELTEYLIDQFQVGNLPDQLPYLLAFRDLVSGFNRSGEQPLNEFLNWWEEEGEKTALDLPEHRDAVEVLTIHKSKGLAYDVVIIPYADWELSETSSTPLWCVTENTPFDAISPLPIRPKSELTESIFAYEYLEEQLFQYMDALNLFYVACTRAREGLILCAPGRVETEKNHPFKLIGDLAYMALHHVGQPQPASHVNDFASHFDVEGTRLRVGEPAPAVPHPSSSPRNVMTLDRYPTRIWKDLLLSRTEASWWTKESDGSAPQRRFGQLMHLALSQLDHTGSLDTLICRWSANGTLGSDEVDGFREQLTSLLQDPSLVPFFAADAPSWKEQDILVPDGSVYRPDRVLRWPTETWVLDFKFTREKKPIHQQQLLRYQRLLTDMQFPHVKAFLYYGLSQELVPVEETQPA